MDDVQITGSETSVRAGQFAMDGLLVREASDGSRHRTHPDFERHAVLPAPVRLRTRPRLRSAVQIVSLG
jgi:hypothetical protein